MHPRSLRFLHRQHGYTLVELMIAVLISLFLLGGLVTLVMGTRRTSSTQSQLTQLQEGERMGMTVMANVIQQAGYFPDATTNTVNKMAAETSSIISSSSFVTGQPLLGTYSAAAPGDVIAVRYVAPKKDTAGLVANTVISCDGTTNTDTASVHTFTNLFQVVTVSGTTYLQCVFSIDGVVTSTVNLVPGLQMLQVWYGVTRTPNGVDTNVNTYVTATNMTAADWNNVTAVKIRLTFQVPRYGSTGGQYSAATQYVERVIGIMSRTGVNT